MSWLFSQALVEAYLPANLSDYEQFAPLSTPNIQRVYCAPDKMTEFSRLSRFGMMYEPLTENHGEGLLTLYLEDFHVNRFQQRQEGPTFQKKICGLQCGELFKKLDLQSYSLKMLQNAPLKERPMIYLRTDTTLNTLKSVRQTWAQIIFGTDFGYSHTPTCTANFASPSMQKHRSCRNFVMMFGKPSPINFEHLMGWPIGWTELKPLGMDKYRLWRQQHLLSCTENVYANS